MKRRSKLVSVLTVKNWHGPTKSSIKAAEESRSTVHAHFSHSGLFTLHNNRNRTFLGQPGHFFKNSIASNRFRCPSGEASQELALLIPHVIETLVMYNEVVFCLKTLSPLLTVKLLGLKIRSTLYVYMKYIIFRDIEITSIINRYILLLWPRADLIDIVALWSKITSSLLPWIFFQIRNSWDFLILIFERFVSSTL